MSETQIVSPDLKLVHDLDEYGTEDFRNCCQCGTCTGSCSLADGDNMFPRKQMLWANWGMGDQIVKDLDIWTCYYCGDCSTRCPLTAEPGETMMALRRYATSRYDWTGISKFLYGSWVREVVAVVLVGLLVVALFAISGAFTAERMPTDTVSMETFIPHEWVHWGDVVMAAVLTFFLLSNTFRMWRFTMSDTKAPLGAYIKSVQTFFVHMTTQKRWTECDSDSKGRWFKHFMLVPAYAGMLVLVMFFLKELQVDGPELTWVSFLGYYITAVLLFVSGDAMLSRLRKKDQIHRHSHESDWMFLILLFLTALTGIAMHFFRILNWPMAAYLGYVVHLAIAVPMLVLEVPFMKWAHLMYRPFALYLKEVRKQAAAS